MSEMLSVASVAKLRGCSKQNILKQINRGTIGAQKKRDEKNREIFYIPLEELQPKEQQAYYAHAEAVVPKTLRNVVQVVPRSLDSFTSSERTEIALWTEILEQWQTYRNQSNVKSKGQADQAFCVWAAMEHPEMVFTMDVLYRKWKAYRAGDLEGLVDKRGKWRKDKSEYPDEIYTVFNAYYLDESRHSIQRCIEYTQLYLQKNKPELLADFPSYSTFRRKIEQIPEPVLVLGRFGAKAYYDRCSAYVRREYENISPNEWWVADTHTFDIISMADNGKTHRIYINAYLDARTGVFVGWYITANPSSEATLLSLKHAIERYGIPKNIYVDNGHEYLTYDIGGLGHRAKKTLADGTPKFAPPGVFERLGIHMTNAIVRNARAKLIERRFRDVKEHISRLYQSYTGGNVVEKPDRLKHVLKADAEERKRHTVIECEKVVSDDKLIAMADKLIDGYMNYQPYGGSVEEDRGKRRIDVYWEHYNDMPQRRAAPDDLALMLMRSTRPQQIGRRGVCVKVAGKAIDFCNDTLFLMQGKKVYVRYDPQCLDSVRVYDLDDKYIMTVERSEKMNLPYGASKEDVAEAMRKVRHAQRITKEAQALTQIPLADEDSALALVMAYAQKNLAENAAKPVDPKVIELAQIMEEPMMEAAVGDIDMGVMVRNAAARRAKQMEENENE